MIANSVLECRATATGAAAVGGSNSSARAPRAFTNRAHAAEALSRSRDRDGEKAARLDRKDVAGRQRGSLGDQPEAAKATVIGREVIDLGAIDERSSASDYAGHQVIFVLLVPKGTSDSRLQDLMVDPSHLTARDDYRGMMRGATLQVDVPSEVRLSAVRDEILAGIARASLEPTSKPEAKRAAEAPAGFPNLTRREREVLQMILEGHPNKNIAADLRISMRTVENHRAKVMKKTGSKSLPALVRQAIEAGAMPDASPR